MCKSEKGITFIVLVITIVVLLIIGSTAAGAAISSYKNAKVKLYMKEMDLIKEKVLLYEEKNKVNSNDPLANIGQAVTENEAAFTTIGKLEEQNKLKSIDLTSDNKYKNYRYLANADVLAVLNVKDLKESRDIIVDIVTKVYSVTPVYFENTEYYSADDIRD